MRGSEKIRVRVEIDVRPLFLKWTLDQLNLSDYDQNKLEILETSYFPESLKKSMKSDKILSSKLDVFKFAIAPHINAF
jgi:hypothetical protein